jgi:hypothetical protein
MFGKVRAEMVGANVVTAKGSLNVMIERVTAILNGTPYSHVLVL